MKDTKLLFKQPSDGDPTIWSLFGWVFGGFPGISQCPSDGSCLLVLEPYIAGWISRIRLAKSMAAMLGDQKANKVYLICHKQNLVFTIKVLLFARDLRWFGVKTTVQFLKQSAEEDPEVVFPKESAVHGAEGEVS